MGDVTVGRLIGIVQAHLDRYGVSEAEFARRIGTSPQTVNSWRKRGIRQPPSRALLEQVAAITGTPYADVLDAALVDSGYIDTAGSADPGITALVKAVEQGDISDAALFELMRLAMTRDESGEVAALPEPLRSALIHMLAAREGVIPPAPKAVRSRKVRKPADGPEARA